MELTLLMCNFLVILFFTAEFNMSKITIAGVIAIIAACNAVIPDSKIPIPNAVSFYQDVGRSGNQIHLKNLTLNKCYATSDLGYLLNDKISQIDTYGNCFVLYSLDLCLAVNTLRVDNQNSCKENLTKCSFNDKLSSFKMVRC